MTAENQLDQALASALIEQLRPIDLTLGAKLFAGSPLSPLPPMADLISAPGRLFWLAALTSYAQGQAHSGLSLDPEMRLVDLFDGLAETMPKLSLAVSDILGTGEALCRDFPDFVVAEDQGAAEVRAALIYRDDSRFVYFQRWYRMEQRLAGFVRERLQRTPDALPKGFSETFQQFFPPSGLVENPWQAVACFAALRHAFSIITGGPGTGKTTTVTRLLGLLLKLPEASRPTAIHMVAPTGKAAERMREAFGANFEAMCAELPEVDAEQLRARKEASIAPASTIHAFLGSRGGQVFKHHAGNPVHCDLLIVDESSMVDLELFNALIDALPETCRLVLLGDKHQLAAVGTGNVFSDLTGTVDPRRERDLNHFSADFRAGFAALSGASLPESTSGPALCGDVVVELTHSYRFRGDSPVGQLAELLLSQARLPGPNEAGFTLCGFEEDWFSRLSAALADYKTALGHGAPPQTLLKKIGSVRVLCAVRRTEHGVEAINRRLGEYVLGAGVSGKQATDGLPFIIRVNDRNLGLSNGDCGVFYRDKNDQLSACFADPDAPSGVRCLNPYVLPAWEPAFALTIHKSQGSEYDAVVIVLPEMKRKFITWELVYTAVTRGRKAVTLILPDALKGAPLEHTNRRSGLRQELLPRD